VFGTKRIGLTGEIFCNWGAGKDLSFVKSLAVVVIEVGHGNDTDGEFSSFPVILGELC
jgi:hypothetical protein